MRRAHKPSATSEGSSSRPHAEQPSMGSSSSRYQQSQSLQPPSRRSEGLRSSRDSGTKSHSQPRGDHGGEAAFTGQEMTDLSDPGYGPSGHGTQQQQYDHPASRDSYRSSLNDISNISSNSERHQRTLKLITLQPTRLELSWVPRHIYHWGLLLLHPGNSQTGDLYHTRRNDPSNHNPNAPPLPPNPQSIQNSRGCVPSISGYGTGLEEKMNYNPLLSSRQKIYKQSIIAHGHVTREDLLRICHLVEHNRPYDAIHNNCQNFCIRVLRQMVTEGILSLGQYDRAKQETYNPVTAQWSEIRQITTDLRNAQ
jgi:hypothetical protein